MDENMIFTTEMFEDAEKYWKNKLSGELVESNLLGDYPRTEQYAGANYKISFGNRIASELIRICKNNNMLLNVMSLTVFKILLYKLTGQSDIIVSSSVLKTSNQNYNKYIAFRDFLSPGMSFRDLLKKVKETVVDGYKYQYYPIRKLIKLLKIQNRLCLLRFIFLLDNIHDREFVVDIINNAENDIIFSINKNDESLEGELTYNSNLFKEETIQRLSDWYTRILTRVLNDTNIKISEISTITEEEKKKILVDFNNTGTEYPKDKTLHQLFDQQVKQKSDHIVIVEINSPRSDGIRCISYGELSERVNRLAIQLRNRGAAPGSIISLMIGHSLDLIVAIPGILKAGCSYLPLDPDYPGDRINYMLKDSGSRLLLISGDLTDRCEGIEFKGEIIEISDGKIEAIGKGNRNELKSGRAERLTTPEDPVYVIYTSGSTGKPKGVIVEHRNVVRLVKNMNYIHFSGKDRMLPTGAIAFDISTFELWGPLLNGVRLYFVDEQIILDAEKLGKVISEHEITILHLIPQLFNQMSTQTTIFAGLKYLLVGGDVVRPRYINEVRNRHKNLKILQMYGPTENTTFTTSFSVDKDYEFNIPIGKPVSNSTVYILGSINWLQPVGIVGQLCAGGDGVARGYLNSPELTGEKFIPNPFVPGQKLYKTGDLARWLPEGNIEFIGRIDNQVKIRGYRIELGEIESVLFGHGKIQEAIIVTKKDEEENPYLCAYFTSEEEIEISELRKYLSERLPDYMIPLFFVPLKKMRLTPNGKIDRRALPEPEVAAGDEYAAPRDEVEKKLVEIWSEVLRVEKDVISIDSNFFRLGGHSLKAAVLISKLHKAFNVKIPLAELWRTPFIRELAEYVKEKGVTSSGERFSSIEPAEEKEYYPLSSAQKRLYVLQQMVLDSTSYNMPLTVVLEGVLDKGKLEESFREFIKRHESLRTSVELVNEEPMQRICDELEFKIEYFDLAIGDTENIRQGTVDRSDTHLSSVIRHLSSGFIRPFDLSRAPLMRVGLIKTGDNRYILMADVHHIVTDGTSMDVLVNEFIVLYSGGELPPLRLQYKDYSEWQQGLRERQGEAIKDQEEYWLKQFESEPPLLNLPTDYPRPAVKSFAGSSLDFQLSLKQTGGLNDLAMNTETTLYMVLLAIYNILMSKISGQEDMIVGTPVAARRHVDLEKIIGMFVNTLAIRTFVPGTKTFIRYLQDVKRVTLNAFEKQDYPFEDLVEKAAVERDTSRNPLFDVMFVLQNISRAPGKIGQEGIGGLKLKPYAFENKTAKFDLILFAFEEGDKLDFVFEYCTKLFEKETIIRLVNYFKRIISSLIKNPHMEILEIDILAEEEKKQLLYDFNDTEAAYPKEKTIHRLFAEQADKTPDSTAVIGRAQGAAESCALTYGELTGKSGQLAHLLRVKGIKTDTIVGITAGRTVEMVVGILGILKAGGAYLPIDPDYPEERITYMLADSGAKVLVTTGTLAKEGEKLRSLEVKRGLETIFIDSHEFYNFSSSQLLNFSTSSSLAYVIYTSGSSGKPKGVLVEHSSVVNLVFSQEKRFDINEIDRVLQFSSICFDASVEQFFMAFSRGAALVLVDKNTILDIDKFEKFITTQSITHLHAVPAFLNNIRLKDRYNLKRFIAGGDVCPVALAKKWSAYCDFYNEYGPTETTVTSIEAMVVEVDETLPRLPIGRPINNTSVYLLDKWMKLVPKGAVGELYIGGAGVARGYLNNPELTNEKFQSKDEVSKQKIYKTGDLARWLPDGNMEFLGRIDQQVKIRGFRIELGEIENELINYRENANFENALKPEIFKVKPGEEITHCTRCLLSANYPGIHFGKEGVCNICRDYEEFKSGAKNYFSSINGFHQVIDKAKKTGQGDYDCMLLFSGGKDSSYVLYRLVDMGLKVLAFTFDNGYISDTAFQNIKRITSTLKVDSIICKTDHMKEIFVESLIRDHTVCSGCFKALTTISTKIALEKNINVIVTGLSRGQIFDTKLYGLLKERIFNAAEIDEKLLLFRRMYHKIQDKMSQLLDITFNDEIFNRIYFVDFFRYDDTPTREIKEYLKKRDTYWSQPGDTGFCSTNCMINDVGIYVHLKDTGYHNYEAPLSWDCRLGLSTRQEMLKEVEFEADLSKMQKILNDIGYPEEPIKEAVVIDKEHENGEKYLCAYFVSQREIDVSGLKGYLSGRLPDYMIPAYFLRLDKIPLTPSGKVDRKALPGPQLKPGDNHTTPRNKIDEKLVKIWSEVLNISEDVIGIDSNFFELGGDSIKATRLTVKINKEMDVEMPLVDIFRTPFIRSLSQYVKDAKPGKYESIEVAEQEEYYPLTTAQQGIYAQHQKERGRSAYSVPETMSLDLNIDRERLEQTFKKLIERHESLKTFFEMIEGKPVQRVRKNVGFGIEYKDAGSFDAPREIIEYFGRPFDLAQPPLIRVGIIETDHAYILILNMHHIITDGVSMEVARKEFMSLYNEEQLPPLRIQYKDYTIWQNRPEIKEKRKKQEEFWLKEYEGDVPVLNMPYDYERPAQRSFEGERIRFVIGEKLPGKLKEMSRQTGATLYMILLAAFYILLCKYTRQEDIIVGSPVTGRNHADLENIIGLFINMIALRNRPERNKIFRHFLMEVKEKVVDALENQEYPFEELVVQLGLQGDPSRNPLFDVVFSLVVPNLETPEEDRDRPGDNNQSKTILNELEYKITNFDLIMGAVEKKGIIEITIAYATALYNRSTIEKMAEHYTDILKQVSNNDEIKLRDILISHNLIAVDPGIPGEDQEEFKF